MSKYRRRSLVILALLTLTAACGDGSGPPFASTSPAAGTTSPFAGAPGSLPEGLGQMVVESAGRAFTLPAAACLQAPGDPEIVLAAARQQAAEVRSLVGQLVSGWPTTTYALTFDYQAYAEELHTAGVAALALAGLIEEEAALVEAWAEWEEGYADPEGGWGPPSEISGRVGGWQAEAAALRRAIADRCAES